MSPSRRAALVVSALLLSLGACSKDRVLPPRTQPHLLGALETARTAFEGSRALVLDDIEAVTSDASLRDAFDGHAATGDVDDSRTASAQAVKADARRVAAVHGFPAALKAYRAALDELAAATAGLSALQRSALSGLVSAGRAEADAAGRFSATVGAHWSAYSQLKVIEELWLTRALAGYYPSQTTGLYSAKVASDAYTVLINPFRDDLTAARSALMTGTDALDTATAGVSAAITVLQGALAPLLASPAP